LESSERASWRRRLSGWVDPAEFARLVDACHESCDGNALIQHGLGFWRDGWIAAQHALHLEANGVRLLHPEPHPDYALLVGDAMLEFEATEGMRPGRRRGDEFREHASLLAQGLSASRPDPSEEWLTPKLAETILKERSKAKALKPYAGRCGLVIYLNESDYGFSRTPIMERFVGSTSAAGQVFQSVDILWGSRLHHIWRAGAAVFTTRDASIPDL
jgi:hypothetical protein